MVCRMNALYQGLKKDGIIFSFSGPISQSIVEGIGEAIRKKMEREYTRPAIMHRVFSVFVEQMQNILNYSDEVIPAQEGKDNELKAGILILGQNDNHFYICCGNYINAERADQLFRDLAGLQALTKEELKKLYKAQRQADPPENSVGSGWALSKSPAGSASPLNSTSNPLTSTDPFSPSKR